MASSKSVVMAALIANGAIAIMKFVGFVLTGSPSMLSETYHSISDTGNQVFLLIGLRFSKRDPNRQHPFGYGKAQFFYAFLVSVLLFGIAGWESAKHGYHKLQIALGDGAAHAGGHAAELPVLGEFPAVYVNYAVLVGAIVFETWALLKARKAMLRQMEAHDWSGYREAFRKTSDVTTLTALTEDTVALAGAGLALIGIWLTETLGDPIYDAAAALLIGIMLMGFALALAWENKRLLLGESMPEEDERELRAIVAEAEGVTRVVDFRTVFFGPRQIIVVADVDFADELSIDQVNDVVDDIEESMLNHDPDIVAAYLEVEEEGESSVLDAPDGGSNDHDEGNHGA